MKRNRLKLIPRRIKGNPNEEGKVYAFVGGKKGGSKTTFYFDFTYYVRPRLYCRVQLPMT